MEKWHISVQNLPNVCIQTDLESDVALGFIIISLIKSLFCR